MQITKKAWLHCGATVLSLFTPIELLIASEQHDSPGFTEGSQWNGIVRTSSMNRNYHHRPGHDVVLTGAGVQSLFESGFTQGTVGVGINLFAASALKLEGESRPESGNLGFIARKADGTEHTTWSNGGVAVKIRASDTTFTYGTQFPSLPVLAYYDDRLIPESFVGGLITSKEIDHLVLHLGHFTKEQYVDAVKSDSGRLKSAWVYGGTYKPSDSIRFSLYDSHFKDYLKRQYVNINYQAPVSPHSALTLDFNAYRTRYASAWVGQHHADNPSMSGSPDSGKENTIWSLAATYATGAHAWTLTYQKSTGSAPYLYGYSEGGGTIYLANPHMSDFIGKGERSVGAQYQLDASRYGVPGLSWTTAYIYGYGIDTHDGTTGPLDRAAHERELFNQIKYIAKCGALQPVSLTLRNSIYRSSNSYNRYLGDVNQWRFIVEYPFSLL
ncbi:OprD family outer membrane porin [Pseudomonas monteilii]|uniref:OprD family outer membrane porin n=1 Tax=Pseudomonas monteilii TaxID=76759 RepID=UPI003D092990